MSDRTYTPIANKAIVTTLTNVPCLCVSVCLQVEGVLNANTHTQHERRLRIVRATEKEDEWNMPEDDGTGENGKEGGGGSGSGDGDKEVWWDTPH